MSSIYGETPLARAGHRWSALGTVGQEVGKDVFEMIQDFGKRRKVFDAHFRNVSAPLPHFVETFPDDGSKGWRASCTTWRRCRAWSGR